MSNKYLVIVAGVIASLALELELLGVAYYLGVKDGIATIQSLLSK